LPGELSHFFDFLWCRNAFEILAHDLFADGGVTCEDRDVERCAMFAALFDPIFYGPGRIAIWALHGGGDPLRDLRFSERVGVEAFYGVIVDVDKAGGENEPAGVEDSLAGSGREFADAGDAVVADAE
jgi:hypothetical protein